MIQHPRIGIRPTIDGRRQGVRESLEVQTMNMAKSVAALLESTLKYPDGQPVECVISPSTIGRVPEAAASHELFKKSNVCATITVTPCWCYGSETMDMSPDIPHAIWGFNGTERPGAVYLAAVLASHAQKGIPAFGIYGKDVQEASTTEIPEDVKEKILGLQLMMKTQSGRDFEISEQMTKAVTVLRIDVPCITAKSRQTHQSSKST